MTIQHGRQPTVVLDGQRRAMWVVTLVIVTDEIKESKLAAVFWFNSPIQKCAKWVALHETVKETADLLRLPDKFSLDGW